MLLSEIGLAGPFMGLLSSLEEKNGPQRDKATRVLELLNDKRRGEFTESAIPLLSSINSTDLLSALHKNPETRSAANAILHVLQDDSNPLANDASAFRFLLHYAGDNPSQPEFGPANRLLKRVIDPETRAIALKTVPYIYPLGNDAPVRLTESAKLLEDPVMRNGLREMFLLPAASPERPFTCHSKVMNAALDPTLSMHTAVKRLLVMFGTPQQKGIAQRIFEAFDNELIYEMMEVVEKGRPFSFQTQDSLDQLKLPVPVTDRILARHALDLVQSPNENVRSGAVMLMLLRNLNENETLFQVCNMLSNPDTKEQAQIILSRSANPDVCKGVSKLFWSTDTDTHAVGKMLVNMLAQHTGINAVANMFGMLSSKQFGQNGNEAAVKKLYKDLITQPDRTKALMEKAPNSASLERLVTLDSTDKGRTTVNDVLSLSTNADTASIVTSILENAEYTVYIECMIAALKDRNLINGVEQLLVLLEDSETRDQARFVMNALATGGAEKDSAQTILRALADPGKHEVAAKLVSLAVMKPASVELVAHLLEREPVSQLTDVLIHQLENNINDVSTKVDRLAELFHSTKKEERQQALEILEMLSDARYRAAGFRRLR